MNGVITLTADDVHEVTNKLNKVREMDGIKIDYLVAHIGNRDGDKCSIQVHYLIRDKNIVDHTKCEHFVQEDVTGQYNDDYRYPVYKTFCTQSGERKEILLPCIQCKGCLEYRSVEA